MRRNRQLGTIVGTVYNAVYQPLEDAAIVLEGDSPRHNDIAALSNDQGEFIFAGLSPGLYTLKVNAVGFNSQQQQVEVRIGQETLVEFTLGVI